MTNIPVSERKHWIGASESAALFGVSPYTTRFELWHQKVGNIPGPDISRDERVMGGQFLEPSIAKWAAEKWYWPLQPVPQYRENPRIERMGCSLDFETIDGLEPVEIKNVDTLVFRDQWAVEDGVIVHAPDHILIQLQHQLSCAPEGHPDGEAYAQRGWIVACVGGNQLYRMEVARHPAMIERIEREVGHFWLTVEANEPPDPKFDIDAAAIDLLYHGSGIEVQDLQGNARAQELAELYTACTAQEKAAREQKKAALAELKVLMGEARGALLDGGYRITASYLKEITTVRKAHWRFAVRKPKENIDE